MFVVWTRRLLSLSLALCFAAGPAAGQRKLYPVDEGGRDRSFAAFRERLRRAVRERDERFILSVLDPKIELSFGGYAGVQDFKEMWLSQGRQADLWAELGTLLSLGGSFLTDRGRREFCAPYTFSNFPRNRDPFDYSAIIGKDVRVRSKPDESAPVVTTLSYDVVRAQHGGGEGEGDPPAGWVKVTTPGGRQGYVAAKLVRSPVDYRACFWKSKQGWRMHVLIAGD